MFELELILQEVSKGSMNVQKAKNLIEKNYELKKQKISEHGEFNQTYKEGNQEGFKSAFEKLKKTVNIDELIKFSSHFVYQISENIPQIEKIQENITNNFQNVGFSPNINGLDSKFSVFRAVSVCTDSHIVNNMVVASQWFGVQFLENAIFKNNKFTAVQFSEVSVFRSDFCVSNFSLARLSNVSFHEARLENNKFSRTTLSDLKIKESDFTENQIVKCDFSEMSIRASRLNCMTMTNVDIQDCEFDSCDIQGVEFENCKFKECIFSNLLVVTDEPIKISNCHVSGKNISGCQTIQEFLSLLNSQS